MTQLVAWETGYGNATGDEWHADRLVAHYEYDPYGNRVNEPAETEYEQPFQFSTHQFDPETGHIYAKERYYQPDEGRWLSADPIGEPGAVLVRHTVSGTFIPRDPVVETAHSYRYVRNAPTGLIDPFGLCGQSTTQPTSQACCYCGPDATGWLSVELARIDQWANQALTEIRKAWPIGIDVGHWWAGRKSARIALIIQVGKQLTYFPDSEFRSANCPRCDACQNTVTLCGMCIHTSEVGNLLYGRLAKSLGFSWGETAVGAWYGNRGEQTPEDKAAVRVGYGLSPDDICGYFSKEESASTASDIVKGAGSECCPCDDPVDSGKNHIVLPPVTRANVWSPHPSRPLRPLPPVKIPPEVIP